MRDDRFNSGWMEELKSRNNIYEVISGYVELARRNNRYFGRCPFHHEKTASFCVNEQQGFFHCFGCGESGDVVSFIQKYENKSFIEAVQILADRAGMDVPQFMGSGEGKERKKQRETMLEITKATAQFYSDTLRNKPEGEKARAYLKKRGIDGEIAVRYGLGYSPDRDSLARFLRLKAFPESLIKECAVTEGDRLYDALSGRLIVPIISADGKVLGFGGRIIEDRKDIAKYKNTAATPLFDKSRTLYGLNLVKKEHQAGRLKNIIVVEGYMDVIALGKAGFLNVVAGMGTAFTQFQARELKKWSTEVYLAYDGDNAGLKACLRSIDILTAENLNVKVIAFDDGMDPDDAISKLGKEGFLKLLENAFDNVEYRLMLIEKRYDLSTTSGRAAYLKAALAFLKSLKNLPEKSVYLQILEHKSGVSLSTLEKQLEKAETSDAVDLESTEDIAKERQAKAPAKDGGAAEFVLNSILFSKPYADIGKIDREWLSQDVYKSVYDYVKERLIAGERPIPGNVLDHAGDGVEVMRILNLDEQFKSEISAKTYFLDCLCLLADNYLDGQISGLLEQYETVLEKVEKTKILLKVGELKKKRISKNIDDKL